MSHFRIFQENLIFQGFFRAFCYSQGMSAAAPSPDIRRYCAEKSDQLIIEPLDIMTLIYHRRSGITHIVADPVPQILEVMKADIVSAGEVTRRLAEIFDLASGSDNAAVISERLEELSALGLVERTDAA